MNEIKKLKDPRSSQLLIVIAWVITVAGILFFLSGCGDEHSEEVVSNVGQTAQSFDDSTMVAEWKKRCVDDNKPLVEIDYYNCTLAPGIYGLDGCELNRIENYYRLDEAWKWILTKTKTNFNACMVDPRANLDWCKGQYEFDLGFFVDMKCQAAATWR